MSIKRRNAFLLLALAAAVPAQGQSILDTVHQLGSTIGQLGGRRKATASAAGAPTAPPTASTAASAATGGGGMVPAGVLADDPSDTALERAPMVQRRVGSFDVRGFRLGMSPREVGRIADREGFVRHSNDSLLTTGSFEVEATRIANARLNRPLERTSSLQLKVAQGSDAVGNRLSCEFTLEPDGPRLSHLEYTTRLDGSTRQQAVDALVRKYGPITRTRMSAPDDVSWSNASGPLDNSSPRMTAVIRDDRMTLFLTRSLDYTQAAQKRLEERAAQIAAARGGGVKF